MNARSAHRWAAVAGAALVAFTTHAGAIQLQAVGLVSDNLSLYPAKLLDPNLQNAWGIAHSAASSFWISSNGTGTSPVYRVDPVTQATTGPALVVTTGGAGNPTGQVFNGNAGAFHADVFLFVSEDGSVSGWRGALGTTAETLVLASPNNVYKGAAIGRIGNDSYLYAANFRAGTIDVVKGAAASPTLAGNFIDPGLPSGYAPFNVQNLNDTLYVAYAQQDASKTDEVAGAGLGFVDSYDLQGNFLARITSGGTLNAPWGLAIAPSSFGALAGDLVVGNFGDGRISIFDAASHGLVGQVLNGSGAPLEIDGLWALAPGNDGNAGSSSLLYFSAGPDDETHGLFGVLQAVPEPSTYLMLFGGLALIGGMVWRTRSQPRRHQDD